jgi:hypothetical protein
VADSTNKIYYFESALSPNIVWVNLNNVNLGPGSGIRAVKVEENYSIIGNVDSQLAPAKPIAYLAPTAANTPQAGVTAPAAPQIEHKAGFKWWWLLPILALLGLLAALPRLFRKPRVAAPVKVVAPSAPSAPATKAAERPVQRLVEHPVQEVREVAREVETDTTIEVTYENNALGDHMESRSDKSDLTPD